MTLYVKPFISNLDAFHCMSVVSWLISGREKLSLAMKTTRSRPWQRTNLRFAGLVLMTMIVMAPLRAASKPHVVAFGKPISVKLLVGPSEDKTIDITVRALYVDSKLKEFTTGGSHDVTDREFVVRRAYRINDALPEDPKRTSKWLWQRDSWLLVNRSSGKVTFLKLPDFDPFYSEISWYRDYAAYCGITPSGERVSAVVAEIGNRKPVFRKDLGKNNMGDATDSNCSPPHWERQPARVTFLPKMGEKFTVSVSGRYADQEEATDEQ